MCGYLGSVYVDHILGMVFCCVAVDVLGISILGLKYFHSLYCVIGGIYFEFHI